MSMECFKRSVTAVISSSEFIFAGLPARNIAFLMSAVLHNYIWGEGRSLLDTCSVDGSLVVNLSACSKRERTTQLILQILLHTTLFMRGSGRIDNEVDCGTKTVGCILPHCSRHAIDMNSLQLRSTCTCVGAHQDSSQNIPNLGDSFVQQHRQ